MNEKTQRERTYIIAEIGINHEGSVDRCAEMIISFAKAGANGVKLQSVDADRSYAEGTESYKLFSSACLTQAETENMFQLSRQCGVEIFTTSGDLHTLEWVEKLEPAAHKISSGLLSCLPIVDATCNLKRPVLMSTGLSDINSIDDAMRIAERRRCQTAIFQCTSKYPCPPSELNLAAIRFLKEKFQVPVGFSDHSIGSDMAFLSVAAGARLIEKHASFDQKRASFDHAISLEPKNFEKMVKQVRLAESAMGSGQKTIDNFISTQAKKFERRIGVAKALSIGHVITMKDLLFLRFAENQEGIKARDVEKVIGAKITTPLNKKQVLTWQNLE